MGFVELLDLQLLCVVSDVGGSEYFLFEEFKPFFHLNSVHCNNEMINLEIGQLKFIYIIFMYIFNFFQLLFSIMPIKKINGYKIFLGEELGRGAYGAVFLSLFRSTRANRIVPNSPALSKSSTKKTVTPILS